MGDSISSTSGNQPVKGEQAKVKTKKHSLGDWAKSIFTQEFKKIDTNGNGIDSVAEAKAFHKWYSKMKDVAANYLAKAILPAGKTIQGYTDKVVAIWAQLSSEHYTKATQIIEEDAQKGEKTSGSKQSDKKSTEKRKRSNASLEPTATDASRKTTFEQAEAMYEEVQRRTEDKSPEEVAMEFKEKNDPYARPSAEQARAHGRAMQKALNESRKEWQKIVKDVQGD